MKAIRDDNLKTLKGRTKIEYIWDYYKLPLAILGILLYVLAYILYGHFTAREPVLYVALVNVNVGGNLKKRTRGRFSRPQEPESVQKQARTVHRTVPDR